MSSPSFLPQELKAYTDPSIADDAALFNKLMAAPFDLLLYFETACDDEMWVNRHPEFMKTALNWFTNKSFEDRLSPTYCEKVAAILRKRHEYVKKFVPANAMIQLKDSEEMVNSLLLSTISESIREGFLRSHERKQSVLPLSNLTHNKFREVYEYASKGVLDSLATKSEKEIFETIDLASFYGISGLLLDCQAMLRKYVTRENVLDRLTLSQRRGWGVLKERCLEIINQQEWGLILSAPSINRICVRFLNFSTITLERFLPLVKLTTDIACAGDWINNPSFTKVMVQVPSLYGLDLHNTTGYTNYFADIPHGLKYLNLSHCGWLSSQDLKKFSVTCPIIEELILSYNTQLDFSAWGDLLKFKELRILDIQRCSQVKDSDLKIILKASGKTVSINLSECGNITENGFYDLAQSCPYLTHLNINRTRIDDTSLVEIGVRCQSLLSLDLTRCSELTEKGIIALVKHAPALEELNITDLNFLKGVIPTLKQMNPRLKVIF